MPPVLSTDLKEHFLDALRRILHPIVRRCIANGISSSALHRMIKQTYVEVAENEFALPFKRQTDSRVALLTGLSRKEVSQIRGRRTRNLDAPRVEDSLPTHVVGRWMSGPPFATPDGIPRRLRYESEDTTQASFTELVRSVGGDIPVRAILDELIRLGSVVLHPDGDVELAREVHIPATDLEGKITLLGNDPAELFATIAHNIDHADEPWLQRKVTYDNIGSEALATLRAESRRAGEEFVRRANALVSSFDRDRNRDAPGGHRARVSIGVYYFEETPDGGDQPDTVQAPPPGRIQRKK